MTYREKANEVFNAIERVAGFEVSCPIIIDEKLKETDICARACHDSGTYWVVLSTPEAPTHWIAHELCHIATWMVRGYEPGHCNFWSDMYHDVCEELDIEN